MPKGKGSYCWVQMINKVDYFARIGICYKIIYLKNEVEISLFDSKGCFWSDKIKLSYLDMFELNSKKLNLMMNLYGLLRNQNALTTNIYFSY